MTTHATTSKKKPLTPEQVDDAARLKDLWERWQDAKESLGSRRVSQETFGRDNAIGGQAAVWQYLNGTTALNLSAALAFARGMGCEVSDFSPALAERLKGVVVVDPPFAATGQPMPRWAFAKEAHKLPPANLVKANPAFNRAAALHEMKDGMAEALPEHLRANWGQKRINPMLADGNEDNLQVDYLSDKVAVEVVYRRGQIAIKNVAGAMLKMIMESQHIYNPPRLRAVIILGDTDYAPPPEVRVASNTWTVPIKTAQTPAEVADIITQMEAEAAELFSQEPQD